MALKIVRADEAKQKKKPLSDSTLGFGQHFTDHMFRHSYEPQQGWHDPRIEPYGPLVLDPASMVLHYGQEIFEGLKAYRGVDGGIRLFRYERNLERLQRSARRLCIPDLDLPLIADAMKQLILLDREWIPTTEGCSLYIRPTVIATDPFLGVRPSLTYLLYIILSPVGAYYPEGFNPVRIMVTEKYVRAAQGGVGEAKAGGNYGASLLAQMEARKEGFSQVLWLDAKERRYVEEVGTMNIFFVINHEVITSPLTGTILPGVTRDSVIQILSDWKVDVVERQVTIDEVLEANQTGELKEVFGSGTAAVISPVGQLAYQGTTHTIGDGLTGELSQRLYDEIVDIQYGKREDTRGWTERIDL